MLNLCVQVPRKFAVLLVTWVKKNQSAGRCWLQNGKSARNCDTICILNYLDQNKGLNKNKTSTYIQLLLLLMSLMNNNIILCYFYDKFSNKSYSSSYLRLIYLSIFFSNYWYRYSNCDVPMLVQKYPLALDTIKGHTKLKKNANITCLSYNSL